MDSGGEDWSVAMNGSRLVQYLDTLLTFFFSETWFDNGRNFA